jgi:hypothetical protein
MNRRHFLAGLMASFVVDPERLLWVPGKTFILPPAGGWRPGGWARMISNTLYFTTAKPQSNDVSWIPLFENVEVLVGPLYMSAKGGRIVTMRSVAAEGWSGGYMPIGFHARRSRPELIFPD